MAAKTLFLTALALVCGCRAQAPSPLRVAAATDLSDAFVEMGKAFASQGGPEPSFTFGASGILARQIIEGAPYHVFAAASAAYADQVIAAKRCAPETRASYAFGRIALVAYKDVPLPDELKGLTDARYKRIAIANPEHAPYGMAAKAALEQAGVWDELAPRLVMAENARQAFAYVDKGEAEIGIVADALLLAVPKEHKRLLPAESHPPLEQVLVVCGDGGERARAFAAFVRGERGRAILERYGFGVP